MGTATLGDAGQVGGGELTLGKQLDLQGSLHEGNNGGKRQPTHRGTLYSAD
jgi:hypothetical protein